MGNNCFILNGYLIVGKTICHIISLSFTDVKNHIYHLAKGSLFFIDSHIHTDIDIDTERLDTEIPGCISGEYLRVLCSKVF